jgi:hypothetical protein
VKHPTDPLFCGMDYSGVTTITGREKIDLVRLCALKGALSLECKGLRHSRGSVYALVKREFGFKGNKESVLAQLKALIRKRELALGIGGEDVKTVQ